MDSAQTPTRRAVLLDPHPMWLEAMEHTLSRLDIEVVGKTTSPEIAMQLVAELRPDLFLLETEIPGSTVGGAECMDGARERVPGIKLVVLSAVADRLSIESAFSAGADAYIVKTARSDEVAMAVRQVFDQSIYLGPRTQRPVEAPPSPAPNSPTELERTNGDDSRRLTRRESQILALVAEGHSNADVATMLWVAEQTVKFHLSNIYRKLGVANRTEASRWAQLHDLLAPLPEESTERVRPEAIDVDPKGIARAAHDGRPSSAISTADPRRAP